MQDVPAKSQKQFAFPHNHFEENVDALIRLRNAVMHNKFLLLYRGLGECYIDGIENVQTSLSAHIINLISFCLPKSVKNAKPKSTHAKLTEMNQMKRNGISQTRLY